MALNLHKQSSQREGGRGGREQSWGRSSVLRQTKSKELNRARLLCRVLLLPYSLQGSGGQF